MFRADEAVRPDEAAGGTRQVARMHPPSRARQETRPAVLARLIDTVVSGSLMTWACHQDGPAAAWIGRDLEAALAPYLTPRPPRLRRSARRR